MDMSNVSPFAPNRAEKRRKEASTEKSSGKKEVVLLEEGMTSPTHPLYDQARKAVQRADDAYIGSPDQISKLVSQAAQKDMQEDLTVFGEAAEKAQKAGLTAEKDGLAPEFDEDGSLIGDAVNGSGTEETGKTWSDSPFSPGANL